MFGYFHVTVMRSYFGQIFIVNKYPLVGHIGHSLVEYVDYDSSIDYLRLVSDSYPFAEMIELLPSSLEYGGLLVS